MASPGRLQHQLHVHWLRASNHGATYLQRVDWVRRCRRLHAVLEALRWNDRTHCVAVLGDPPSRIAARIAVRIAVRYAAPHLNSKRIGFGWVEKP